MRLRFNLLQHQQGCKSICAIYNYEGQNVHCLQRILNLQKERFLIKLLCAYSMKQNRINLIQLKNLR